MFGKKTKARVSNGHWRLVRSWRLQSRLRAPQHRIFVPGRNGVENALKRYWFAQPNISPYLHLTLRQPTISLPNYQAFVQPQLRQRASIGTNFNNFTASNSFSAKRQLSSYQQQFTNGKGANYGYASQ